MYIKLYAVGTPWYPHVLTKSHTMCDTSVNFLLVQIDDSFSCTNYIKIYNSGRSGIEYDQILVCFAK